MPLLTLHLLRAAPGTSVSALLAAAQADTSVKVVVASQAQHVVIAPQHLDREILLSQAWDVLLLLQSTSTSASAAPAGAAGGAGTLPASLHPLTAASYSMACGIPSRLLENYGARNAQLRAQPPPPATGSLDAFLREGRPAGGGERLEVSDELLGFMHAFERRHAGEGHVPMTMLNLLSFHPNGKESYARYGRAFVEVAGRRGGDAKLVGNVVPATPPPAADDHKANAAPPHAADAENAWHEVSIVHYPSIRSFCDMLAGKDYQDINERYRLNALRDTFLLCTTETFDPEPRGGSRL